MLEKRNWLTTGVTWLATAFHMCDALSAGAGEKETLMEVNDRGRFGSGTAWEAGTVLLHSDLVAHNCPGATPPEADRNAAFITATCTTNPTKTPNTSQDSHSPNPTHNCKTSKPKPKTHPKTSETESSTLHQILPHSSQSSHSSRF